MQERNVTVATNRNGPITWYARGTLYRLRPLGQGRPPLLYATDPTGYARVTKAPLSDDDVARWAELPLAERTARAAELFR